MSRTPARLLTALFGLMLALCMGGCGLLQTQPGPGTPGETAMEPLVELEVDAPDALKPLLANNLDLARLTRLAGQETVSEPEIARLVAAAPAQVRELLETEGYFEPAVQVQRVPLTSPPRVRVSVQPGPRVLVGRVTLEVEGELERRASEGDERARPTLEKWRETWPLKPGMPFRNTLWTDVDWLTSIGFN